MLGNNDGGALFPQNQVRTALTDGKKSQTLQSSCGLRPVDIAWQFHATARMGSSIKCRRTCRGCSPGSKYPFTASATIACSSAKESPWVVIPPPWGSSHRATKLPLSKHVSTRKVTSLIRVVCQPFATKASRVVDGISNHPTLGRFQEEHMTTESLSAERVHDTDRGSKARAGAKRRD
jgi:hypothetical protein